MEKRINKILTFITLALVVYALYITINDDSEPFYEWHLEEVREMLK